MGKPTANSRKLTDFMPDLKNANKHTLRGIAMLEDSLQELGAGRSIVVDRNNNVIAGNATLETAVQAGFEDAIIVPTDGKQLVVVQRVDLDLDSPRGRKLALADNRIAQVDLDFDPDVLKSLQDDGVDLSTLWNEGELAHLLNMGDELDYESMWQGMPEFEQEDREAFKTIKVHFASAEDYQSFARLIDQPLTEHSRSTWFPRHEKENLKGVAWKSES